MRILLLHPEDSPEHGPWADETWDRAVDLGRGGAGTYKRWREFLRCPAEPLRTLKLEDFPAVKSAIASGLGRVIDREGLDWWELTAILFHQRLETLMALQRFAFGLGAGHQVFVTRPGIHADGLRLFLGDRLHCFPAHFSSRNRGLSHYLRIAFRFKPSQISQIFWDKFDTAYEVRRRFAARQRPCLEPVVLLPTAYGNVSSTGIAYADTLPESKFLMVATRQSGWVVSPPPNVTLKRLASYAPGNTQNSDENTKLDQDWRSLRHDLDSVPEIAMLGRLGFLESFSRLFRTGLGIRDAWREVLDREPVRAVLCGDDSNPYTNIPLLLAKMRGLPSLSCHHGAFDGRYVIKKNHADVILAKGRMEQDYLVRVCGLPASAVEIGAPAQTTSSRSPAKNKATRERKYILFLSEYYEVSSGRCEEFYRDVLPSLADLAVETGRRLVLKLHPFEIRKDRERLLARILTPGQRRVTEVVSGRITHDILLGAWFGITVLSSVTMECALLGIPCFLCQWLEFWPYGYIDQFGRFGAGRILESPEQIRQIPQIIEREPVPVERASDWWQPVSKERLGQLFLGRQLRERAVEDESRAGK